jgi:hypothetical protein
MPMARLSPLIALVAACAGDLPPQPPRAEARLAWTPSDCDGDGWCAEHPLPHGVPPAQLWGSGADDVWAIGGAGTILHRDAGGWSREHRFADELRDRHFQAIAGHRPDDVWVVGGMSTALHWDGRVWTRSYVSDARYLVAVGLDDAGRAWTADTKGGVWTWSGTAWRADVKHLCRGGCSWPTRRSAGGGQVLVLPGAGGYWDGHAEVTRVPAPDERTFGGARASRLWLTTSAVGSALERWDGQRWVRIETMRSLRWSSTDPIAPGLRDLWGATDDDVWIVGRGGVVLRWDGRDLTPYDSPTDGDLESVWGSGPDDVWATGPGGMIRWDGRAWSMVTASATRARLDDVWALDACDAWAVGTSGTALRRSAVGWTVVATGVAADLHGVGGSAPDDVWMVGDGGVILHAARGGVRRVASPIDVDLFAVAAVSARDAWAVGDRGVILRWDGTVWTQVPSPTNRELRHISVVHGSHIVAAGDDFITWDGARWSAGPRPPARTPQGTGDRFTGVWALAADDIVVAARWWTLVAWNGAHWVHLGARPRAKERPLVILDGSGQVLELPSGREPPIHGARPLRAIWTSADGHVWAVGEQGRIVSRPAARPMVCRPREEVWHG